MCTPSIDVDVIQLNLMLIVALISPYAVHRRLVLGLLNRVVKLRFGFSWKFEFVEEQVIEAFRFA
jgi:hypothetical protein